MEKLKSLEKNIYTGDNKITKRENIENKSYVY